MGKAEMEVKIVIDGKEVVLKANGKSQNNTYNKFGEPARDWVSPHSIRLHQAWLEAVRGHREEKEGVS